MVSATIASRQAGEADAIQRRLGALGDEFVPILVLRQIDAWLSRPAWLYQGAEFLLEAPDLPPSILLRHKVRILHNLLASHDLHALVDLFWRAMQWPMGRVGGLIAGYSPDLGTAVDALLDVARISNPHLGVADGVEAGTRRLQLQPTVDLGPVELVVALSFAFQMHRVLTSRAGPCPGHVELSFTWPGPEDPARLPAPERAVLRFGTPSNTVAYPADWDRLRNPMHDPVLWEMGLRMARAEATKLREQSVVSQVRQAVARSLRDDQRPPSVREVAASLGKSIRSLERSLTEAGTMFRAIVEEERKQIAAAMLSEADRSIQEISDSLGFSDRTSFTRSFRTWFSVPPAAFRMQLAAGRRAF